MALVVGLLISASSALAAYPAAIGRANLDRTGADQSVITTPAIRLAVDSEHIYWINPNTGAIGRANLDGTGVDENFISGAHEPDRFSTALAVGPAHIYWANRNHIGRANLNGTGIDRSFISDPSGIDIEGLAVDSAHVYWTTYEWVGRANLNGTGLEPHFIFPSPTMLTHGDVAVDSAHIYSVYREEFGPDATERIVIGRANLDGSEQETFIELDSTLVPELAIDPVHIFWANSQSIGRADLDGTGVDHNFVKGGHRAEGVAVDSDHVYWTNARRPGLRIGKPEKQRRRGTATLPVKVFGPGEIELTGKGLRTVTETAESADKFRLAVKPKGAKERKLERRGSVRVTPEVTFTLTGADSRTKTEPLKLVERSGGGAGAFDARSGKYRGRIAGFPVTFKVTRNEKVKNPEFTLILATPSRCVTFFEISGRDKISHDGRFKLTDSDASIKGKFVSRRKVKGEVHGEEPSCGEATDPYTVRHLGDRR
jgi:sugar lactone lactonase YvrE